MDSDKDSQTTEPQPPGLYWLVSERGPRKRAIVTEDGSVFIYQNEVADDLNVNMDAGSYWWMPPRIYDEWRFEKRE